MEIRVVACEWSPTLCPEKDFVHVQTSVDPADDTVTLATIRRVVEKASIEDPAEPARRVKTLVMRQPMPPEVALKLAQRYAERKQIPVVYAEQSIRAAAQSSA